MDLWSGRVKRAPHALIHEVILGPQFDYEIKNFLPFYLVIEKVMVREGYLLGLLSREEAEQLITALGTISRDKLEADPSRNFSDISFAIESTVEEIIGEPVVNWHVDKSRNDFQACAQRMFGRYNLLNCFQYAYTLSQALIKLARENMHLPMPGYTHYQAAQIITPGFYLASINESLLSSMRRFIYTYDDINKCPLGAGAMAGLELAWNRERIAEALGFTEPVSTALSSVAEREWVMKISFELALVGTIISRFCTDLSIWGSSEFGFIDLPDELASVSSAMPQKKNFTILERIRGETVHLSSLHFDLMMGQRNISYTNMVEVSKEGGRYFNNLFTHFSRICDLLTLILENLQFVPLRMQEACSKDYYGGFSLANALTLQDHIPYRKAQVIAGEYIRHALTLGISPGTPDLNSLKSMVLKAGYTLSLTEEELWAIFDVGANLERKKSTGSTNPVEIAIQLDKQEKECLDLLAEYHSRDDRLRQSLKFTGLNLG